MLVKIMILMTCSIVAITSAHHPRYCSNCEEEIWEEVPCKSIPLTSVATTVKPTSTTPSTTTKYKTTAVAKGATLPSTPSQKPTISFKQCYCECKTGCKEFCRKGQLLKDIKQLAQTSSNLNDGRSDIKHVDSKYISTAAPNSKNYNNKPSTGIGNYDVNIVDAGPLPIISKAPPHNLPQPYKHQEFFLEDVEKFLHQDDKQSEGLAYYPNGSGSEVPFYVNGEKINTKDVEPQKIKSNYILTKPSMLSKSNEREFNAAIDNYLKDYSNLNAPQGNAFQAAYSVSYE